MARERISDLKILEDISMVAACGRLLMQKMSCQASEYRAEEFDNIVLTLREEKLQVMGSIKAIHAQLESCLSDEMLAMLGTALKEQDHCELIKRMPEDSIMHAICRLYIITGQLDRCSDNLMLRATNKRLLEELKAEAQEEKREVQDYKHKQEVAGEFDCADNYFFD